MFCGKFSTKALGFLAVDRRYGTRFAVAAFQALKAIVAQERPHVLGLQEIRISAPAADTPSAPKKRRTANSSSSSFTDIVKAILPDYDTVCELKGNGTAVDVRPNSSRVYVRASRRRRLAHRVDGCGRQDTPCVAHLLGLRLLLYLTPPVSAGSTRSRRCNAKACSAEVEFSSRRA